MKHTRILAALATLTVLPTLTAQSRVFVVDANGGPGTHYLDLPAALGNAEHGDVYRIRSGDYSAAITDRGVTLLAEGSVRLPYLGVQDLPAGRTFNARNLGLSGVAPRVVLRANAGRVHLDGVASAGTTPASRASLEISACRLVTARGFSGATLHARESTVSLTNSSFLARAASAGRGADPAVFAYRCDVVLANCFAYGGDGRASAPMREPSEGVVLRGGHAQITRGIVRSGGVAGSAHALVVAEGHELVLDPATQLEAYQAATIRNLDSRIVPFALGWTNALARTDHLVATLFAGEGDLALVYVGRAGDPVWTHGTLCALDLANVALIGAGVVQGQGLDAMAPLPNDPRLLGIELAVQCAVFYQTGYVYGLAAPDVTVVPGG